MFFGAFIAEEAAGIGGKVPGDASTIDVQNFRKPF
jgi:hypothetical protein